MPSIFNMIQPPNWAKNLPIENYRWLYRVAELLNIYERDKVPYTGATGDVDLGDNNLNAATAKFGDVDGGNYSEFETGGFPSFNGTAKCWVDVDFPIIIRTTGPNIPTLTVINGNLTAPEWAVNDFNMCESQEFVHLWEEGSEVFWHIHLTTDGVDIVDTYVRFEVEYGYVTPHGAWVFPATLDSGELLIPANTPDKTMFIFSLGSFTPTGVTIGGHCMARLKRIAAGGTAPTLNPWVPMLQLHIHCDTLGSREISSK